MIAAISILPAIVWICFDYSTALKSIPIVGFYILVHLLLTAVKRGE